MEIEEIRKKEGHWMDMIQLSPSKKAFRRDIHTDRVFLIDEWGTVVVYRPTSKGFERAREADYRGYRDWHPVIEETKS